MEVINIGSSELKKIIPKLTQALASGQVLVLPTDTVYGLVCDATNEKAVEKIFEIKKRDRLKPLAVFVKDIEMAEKYAVIGSDQKGFLKKNWPGAATIILEAKNNLSKLIYKNGTIGLRQPDYELVAGILKEFKKPLAQTSANISGRPATTKTKEVLKQFGDQDIQPDMIIDAGDLPDNKPSKVVDFTTDKVNIVRI